MRSLVFRVVLIAASFASAAWAQHEEQKQALQPTGEAGEHTPDARKSLPSPGPEMQRLLSTFEGTWALSEKYEPSDWMPRGGAGAGQQVWSAGPGGLSLIEEYRSENPTGNVFGLSVTWWDDKAQGYRALWCVNTNPGGCTVMASLAKWQGSKFVLGDEFERDGKRFTFKEVFSDITPKSFTQMLYQGATGGELKLLMTIRATKVTTGKTRS